MTFQAPRFIEESNPRSFQAAVLEALTKRDKNDWSRIAAKISDITLLRFVASRYMDPLFTTAELGDVYRRFGRTVESAYQTMVAEIAEVDEAKRKKVAVHHTDVQSDRSK